MKKEDIFTGQIFRPKVVLSKKELEQKEVRTKKLEQYVVKPIYMVG